MDVTGAENQCAAAPTLRKCNRRTVMKAKDVMTSPVVSVEQDSTVLQAVRIML